MRFHLHSDWRRIARHAVSVRYLATALVLSGVEVGFTYYAENPPIDRLLFAILSACVSAGALFYRFKAQKEFE